MTTREIPGVALVNILIGASPTFSPSLPDLLSVTSGGNSSLIKAVIESCFTCKCLWDKHKETATLASLHACPFFHSV